MLSKDYERIQIASDVISELIDKQITLSSLETLPTSEREKAVYLGKCACEVQKYLLNKRLSILKEEA